MSRDLPPYYFRIRENGAVAFRVETENQNHRLELEQIAIIQTRRGDYKAHGDRALTAEDKAAIETWLSERMVDLAQREVDRARLTAESLNLTTQWAQSRASDAELEEVTDQLLLAMHDLRNILVRKMADRTG